MRHIGFLFLAGVLILYGSGGVARWLAPPDSVFITWIIVHGGLWSPCYPLAHGAALWLRPKWRRDWRGSLKAFGIGILVWTVVFAVDFRVRILPDYDAYMKETGNELRKEKEEEKAREREAYRAGDNRS